VALTRDECGDLFTAVRESGLDPRDCELINKVTEDWTRLIHKPSGSYIDIQPSSGGTYLFWQDKSGIRSFSMFRGLFYSRANDIKILTAWVAQWASQASARDIWSELAGIHSLVTNNQRTGLENSSFTAPERKAISRQIEQIKEQVHQTPELTAEQISGVEQKLDDLVEASKRVGRKDWLTMLYGAAFGMIVNDAVPAHIVQAVISMTIHGLGHLFGLGSLPSALPPAP
jgi:hypothetical protein